MFKIFNRRKKKTPEEICNTCKYCTFNVNFGQFFCRNSKSEGNERVVTLDDYCGEWEAYNDLR